MTTIADCVIICYCMCHCIGSAMLTLFYLSVLVSARLSHEWQCSYCGPISLHLENRSTPLYNRRVLHDKLLVLVLVVDERSSFSARPIDAHIFPCLIQAVLEDVNWWRVDNILCGSLFHSSIILFEKNVFRTVVLHLGWQAGRIWLCLLFPSRWVFYIFIPYVRDISLGHSAPVAHWLARSSLLTVWRRMPLNSNCLRQRCGHWHTNKGAGYMAQRDFLDSGRPDVQIVTRSECSFQKFAFMTTSVSTIAGGRKQLDIVISCLFTVSSRILSVNAACCGDSVTSIIFDLSMHVATTGVRQTKLWQRHQSYGIK